MVDANSSSEVLKESAAELRQIQLALRKLMERLHGNIGLFQSASPSQVRFEVSDAEYEAQAKNLEEEIKQLRLELKAVKELLGIDSEKRNLC